MKLLRYIAENLTDKEKGVRNLKTMFGNNIYKNQSISD